MSDFSYKLLFIRLLPEIILVVGGLVVLFFDQTLARNYNLRQRSATFSIVAALFAFLGAIAIGFQDQPGSWLGGMLVLSPINALVKQFLLLLVILTLLIAPADRFTKHIGEFYSLILFGSVGMMVMAGAEELLTAFIGLEIASLTLYVLTAFNKQNINSTEAALKYFLFGSVSAAFTLFGISLIFGLCGTTSFAGISTMLPGDRLDPLLLLAICLVVIGFGFKIAAAPLHLWAPDAYQGAPIPSAALIASGSKLVSFFLFAKFFAFALRSKTGSAAWGEFLSGWMPALALLALASILFGNLLALAQTNIRRLLAYSAVAHAGYALLSVMAGSALGISSLVYYLFTYGLALIGIFAIIGMIEDRHGEMEIADFAGLSRRSPALAFCLLIFVLSLAGIPPLAGFFGKFYIFLAALKSPATGELGLLWLVIAAIGASCVSLYYYLLILKQAWVAAGDSAEPAPRIPLSQTGLVALLAACVVIFGCFPTILLDPIDSATTKLFAPVESPAPNHLTLSGSTPALR